MLFKTTNIREYVDPKVIFEFGAFNGADSIKYGTAFPEAKVYSMEADPKNYELTKNHIDSRDNTNVELFYYAISDRTGVIDFYPGTFTRFVKQCKRGIDAPGWSGSILKQTDLYKEDQVGLQKFEETIQVPSITIKDFCAMHNISEIDFMHIDVEGAIKQVIDGFGEIRPKLIYAEVGADHVNYKEFFTNSNTEAEHLEMFSKLGYTRMKKYRGNSLFLHKA